MRKSIVFGMLAMLVSSIYFSCNKSKDDNLDFYMEHTFLIQTSDSIYTKTDTLDLASYAEQFENIEINEITVKFTDYEGPENLEISGTVHVSALGGVGMEEICSFPLQPIDSLIDRELALPIQQAGIERLIELIKAPNQPVGELSITIENPGQLFFVVMGIIKFKQAKDSHGQK